MGMIFIIILGLLFWLGCMLLMGAASKSRKRVIADAQKTVDNYRAVLPTIGNNLSSVNVATPGSPTVVSSGVSTLPIGQTKVCVKAGAWKKDFPIGLTVREYRQQLSALTSCDIENYDAYCGKTFLIDPDVIAVACSIEFVRSLSPFSSRRGLRTNGIVYGVVPPAEKFKIIEAETSYIEAWKIFVPLETTKAGKPQTWGLFPLSQKGFGEYNLIESNWYLDDKRRLGNEPDYFLKMRCPMLEPTDSEWGNRGFYCFKTPDHCYNEIHSYKSYYASTGGPFMVAKIQIWGDILEADFGYRAEYFDFLEIYNAPSSETLSGDALKHTKEWLLRDVHNTANLDDAALYEISRQAVATSMGWPFDIKDFKDVCGAESPEQAS